MVEFFRNIYNFLIGLGVSLLLPIIIIILVLMFDLRSEVAHSLTSMFNIWCMLYIPKSSYRLVDRGNGASGKQYG